MKRTLAITLILAILLPKRSFSQFYLEPFVGYQKNLNSPKNNMLNTGVQLALKLKKYEFLIQVQKSWPQSLSGVDSSFTTNTSLPLSAPAYKTINTSAFTFAIGNRLKVAGGKTKNSYFIKLYTGVMFQNNAVKYDYDKANYIILNPDKTINVTGLFVSGGFEYMRQIKSNRLFVELNFSSPPSGNIKYPSSFNLMAPVTINIGYSIKISKK